MDAAAEVGRKPVRKHQIQPEYGDEEAGAGRDCRTRLLFKEKSVVVFTLKAVPVSTQYFLTSVLVELTRTPSVRGHRLTTQKGYTYQKEKKRKGPRKVNTHAIIGK